MNQPVNPAVLEQIVLGIPGGDEHSIEAEACQNGLKPEPAKTRCNSTANNGFLREEQEQAHDSALALSLKATDAETSTIVLFTRPGSVVLQCEGSLQ